MTDIQTWLDQGRTLADQAADHVGRLAAGDDKWTMTVPPKDTDSDMALMSLLDGRLPQALAALQAVLNLHKPYHFDGYEDGPGGPAHHVIMCSQCEPDADRIEYPCATVRAIQDAIKEQES